MSPEDIIETAAEAGLTITTAESCTGGMVAAALTDVPGSSAVFSHGVVTYSNAAKTQLLQVDPALFDTVGAVSTEVAEAMAQGAAKLSGADIAVAITGIAGPGGSEHKPEGRVCFGLWHKGATRTETIDFGPLGRLRVRRAATRHALNLIESVL